MESIPPRILDAPVAGTNLLPGARPGEAPTLRDQVGDVPTLLVFLRHFG